VVPRPTGTPVVKTKSGDTHVDALGQDHSDVGSIPTASTNLPCKISRCAASTWRGYKVVTGQRCRNASMSRPSKLRVDLGRPDVLMWQHALEDEQGRAAAEPRALGPLVKRHHSDLLARSHARRIELTVHRASGFLQSALGVDEQHAR
jgi:hypothetical protein